jgi:hypothetical protein
MPESTAIGIGSGILETAGNIALAEQQYQQEQELMSIQHQNQQQLNQQGHELQYDMWKKTNYPAQVRMMEKAGLNPALMYKGAGAGGTTGSQSGGAASKGNAPQRPQMNMATMLMGLEMKSLEAGIENQRAQTEKAKEEANLTKEQAINEAGGVRQKLNAQVGQLVAQTNLNKEQTEYISKEFQLALDDLKNEIRRTDIQDYDAKSKRIGAEAQKSGAEAQHKIADAKQIDTLTKKIELTVREKIAQMQIDQSNKEAWMKFASDQIGTLVKAGTDIFKAITQLEGDLAKAFGEVVPF